VSNYTVRKKSVSRIYLIRRRLARKEARGINLIENE